MVGCTATPREDSPTPADRGGPVATIGGRDGAPNAGGSGATTPATLGTTNDCATLAVIPAGVTTGSNLRSDVDADGRPDAVGTYRTVTGDQWRLRVAFAAGGGSELVLPIEPGPEMVAALGGAPLGAATQPRTVLFVATSSGASSRTVELFALDGCEVVALTNAEGTGPRFVVGASLGHQEGLRCERLDDQLVVVEVLSVPAAVGGFSVTSRPFTRDGNALLTVGEASTTISPTPPVEAGRVVGCGDVTL